MKCPGCPGNGMKPKTKKKEMPKALLDYFKKMKKK
jgi:hypothetical protein